MALLKFLQRGRGESDMFWWGILSPLNKRLAEVTSHHLPPLLSSEPQPIEQSSQDRSGTGSCAVESTLKTGRSQITTHAVTTSGKYLLVGSDESSCLIECNVIGIQLNHNEIGISHSAHRAVVNVQLLAQVALGGRVKAMHSSRASPTRSKGPASDQFTMK
jgi:hypothetical protein